MTQYLGHFYCDHCSGEYRLPVWILDGARLCAPHYRHVTGNEPPPALALEDLPAESGVVASEPPWTKLTPGLRMRPVAGAPYGIELQGVRNVQLERGTVTVSDRDPWALNDEELVALIMMASAHRDDLAPNKAFVRVALLRILHGTEKP